MENGSKNKRCSTSSNKTRLKNFITRGYSLGTEERKSSAKYSTSPLNQPIPAQTSSIEEGKGRERREERMS